MKAFYDFQKALCASKCFMKALARKRRFPLSRKCLPESAAFRFPESACQKAPLSALQKAIMLSLSAFQKAIMLSRKQLGKRFPLSSKGIQQGKCCINSAFQRESDREALFEQSSSRKGEQRIAKPAHPPFGGAAFYS